MLDVPLDDESSDAWACNYLCVDQVGAEARNHDFNPKLDALLILAYGPSQLESILFMPGQLPSAYQSSLSIQHLQEQLSSFHWQSRPADQQRFAASDQVGAVRIIESRQSDDGSL